MGAALGFEDNSRNKTMSEHIFNIIAFIMGGSFIALNKSIGELSRQFQLQVTGRDFGLMSFRVPFIIGGVILLALSILTW